MSFHFEAKVLNLGGGFGIRYTKEDEPIQPSQYVSEIIKEVKNLVDKYSMEMPEIWIEPGRSLVGDAGITFIKLDHQKRFQVFGNI